MKNPGRIRSFEEIMGKEPDNLHPCPCDRAKTCAMKESCLGCEVYTKWLKGNKDG